MWCLSEANHTGRESVKRDLQPDWIERKTAELIAKIKRSQWAEGCFRDARHFIREGYAHDVALVMAWRYWGT